VRTVSRYILSAESILLAYLSFLGLLLVGGSVIPFATGSFTSEHFVEALVGCVILTGLVVGWRLMGTFLLKGQVAARRVPRSWWVAAGLIGLISILAFVGNLVNSDTPLEPLRLGVLFLPSYLHLACEVWWRAV
jgi:uncharacterized membrane protein YciS (DUF1049 family)